MATGKIEACCEPTHTEEDFVALIDHHIQSRPHATKYHFVVDNLNTHMSEGLVRYVAQREGLDPNTLGKKGTEGILKNKKTRQEFLSDSSHSIRFYYTPKHASWMNQIEIVFGIVSRKAIRNGRFFSKQHLKQRLLEFIKYFNRKLAHPFKWSYGNKPLTAS